MDTGPIGHLVFFLQLCIVSQCNVFELLDDMTSGLMHAFDKINDEI
jgi:hypothetical protein